MEEKRFNGNFGKLRSPERLARLEIERVLDSVLLDSSHASVLDVGAGTGVFIEAFAGRGCRAAGVDINPEILAAARTFAPDTPLCCGAAENLPFKSESFDLVFPGHVLHESDAPARLLDEAHRVARQQVIVLEWPYRDEPAGPPIHHRIRAEDVVHLARQQGFGAIESKALTHMVLFRLAKYRNSFG